MAAKNWCFTLNGLTDATPEALRALFSDCMGDLGLHYIVYQHERGSSDHLQGYFQLEQKKALPTVKKLMEVKLPGAHFEKAKGSPKQNREYCTKEETRISGPYEFGEMSVAGKRTDLDTFVSEMKKEVLTEHDVIDRFPEIAAKYPRFVRDVRRLCRKTEIGELVPRDGWQTDLVSYLHSPAHPRKVRWYYDPSGNCGKSYFARHFGRGIGYVVTGGKHADIYYAYTFQSVVFFDWPRAQEEAFPYGVVESFKNGYFLSTKYESVATRFQPPHVIIFANFEPDTLKLSADRWDIHYI